jgi:hypothetical protein
MFRTRLLDVILEASKNTGAQGLVQTFYAIYCGRKTPPGGGPGGESQRHYWCRGEEGLSRGLPFANDPNNAATSGDNDRALKSIQPFGLRGADARLRFAYRD